MKRTIRDAIIDACLTDEMMNTFSAQIGVCSILGGLYLKSWIVFGLLLLVPLAIFVLSKKYKWCRIASIALGVKYGDGACVCEVDGIRFGFLTCYDVYFNEQIEYLASQKCDIILIPGYQRGEATDIIRAQTKMIAFRCNAFIAKSSYSMDSDEKGGCSMIVAPDGKIIKDLGKEIGTISADVDPKQKHMRTAGFGGGMIRNDDFINDGLRPDVFKK